MSDKKPTFEVSLPPLGVPLKCKENSSYGLGRSRVSGLQTWTSFTNVLVDSKWERMKPGDIVMFIDASFYSPAKFDTHDWWKLTFLHKGERVSYLWNSHSLYVPGPGGELNLWTDFWEPFTTKESE